MLGTSFDLIQSAMGRPTRRSRLPPRSDGRRASQGRHKASASLWPAARHRAGLPQGVHPSESCSLMPTPLHFSDDEMTVLRQLAEPIDQKGEEKRPRLSAKVQQPDVDSARSFSMPSFSLAAM
jgi:hypothetical protein